MADLNALGKSLSDQGYFVLENALAPAVIQAAREDLLELRRGNQMRPAQIGKGLESARAEAVRNDFTYWFGDQESSEVRAELLKLTDVLKAQLNRELFMGIAEFEGHYAWYPAGSFYRRHSDVFQRDDARVVSFILYLNEIDWSKADGGQLRLYLGQENGIDRTLDVEPHAGTMVCFLSQDFEHEVLSATRDRFSFTGWFRRRT